jgi:hypothetical protein
MNVFQTFSVMAALTAKFYSDEFILESAIFRAVIHLPEEYAKVERSILKILDYNLNMTAGEEEMIKQIFPEECIDTSRPKWVR